MPKKAKKPDSLWNRYWDYDCEIRQCCLGVNTKWILDNIDTNIPIDEKERVSILRMLGFDPTSVTVWIGISTKSITVMGHHHYPGLIFAGESREPHSRFAVIDGFPRREQ